MVVFDIESQKGVRFVSACDFVKVGLLTSKGSLLFRQFKVLDLLSIFVGGQFVGEHFFECFWFNVILLYFDDPIDVVACFRKALRPL